MKILEVVPDHLVKGQKHRQLAKNLLIPRAVYPASANIGLIFY